LTTTNIFENATGSTADGLTICLFFMFVTLRYAPSGACVRLAEEQKVSIDSLTLQQLQAIDSRFEADVSKVWDYEVSVERKSSLGGTCKASVMKQIDDILAFAQTLM
jgi:argininosuccinate lyase